MIFYINDIMYWYHVVRHPGSRWMAARPAIVKLMPRHLKEDRTQFSFNQNGYVATACKGSKPDSIGWCRFITEFCFKFPSLDMNDAGYFLAIHMLYNV